MSGIGIFDGDVLVVDRSIPPKDGRVVIAAMDGELLVKIYRERANSVFLVSANKSYPTIKLSEGQEVIFWGVVTATVHHLTASLIRSSQY